MRSRVGSSARDLSYNLNFVVEPFEPHPLLRNAHAMTLASAYWPRRFVRLPAATDRLFEVEPGVRLMARCHWQAAPRKCATLILVHGLEGSSESGYMLGVAEKAYVAGLNVLRVNQRNCGGSEHLTPTLYNSGLSGDLRAIVRELIERDALAEVFLAGFSMGGNLVLKAAGEWGAAAPREVRGVCAVGPTFDLAACVDAIDEPRNFIYHWHFVRSLKARMRRKARLFPGRFALDGLVRVRTVREFDDVITAPHFGFRDAADYYDRMSARHVLAAIGVPTLVLTAQNDPLVPFGTFRDPALAANPHITLEAPRFGGHCAFLSRHRGDARFWAEARIVRFCCAHSTLVQWK